MENTTLKARRGFAAMTLSAARLSPARVAGAYPLRIGLSRPAAIWQPMPDARVVRTPNLKTGASPWIGRSRHRLESAHVRPCDAGC